MRIFILFMSTLILCGKLFSQNETHYKNTDSTITEALTFVSADSLLQYTSHLQSYGSRFMMDPNRKDVALWIKDKFLSFGITDVRLDSFLCHTYGFSIDTLTWQYNVEAKIQGTTYPNHEMLVMGHYDSFNESWDWNSPYVSAPGADDNASGTAAVIECARVFMEMNYQPDKTLVFLATAGEELMYSGESGAKHYAQEAYSANRKIGMTINNDMIAWNDSSWTLCVKTDANSQHITNLTVDAIYNYTSLNYVLDAAPWTYADLEPFIELGFHGVYFMEKSEPLFYPYYHTINDIVDYIDTAYHAEITRLNIALMLKYDHLLRDAAIEGISGIPLATCSDTLFPHVNVTNYGSEPLSSMTIVSSVNNTDSITYAWSGHIGFLETLQIELPKAHFVQLPQNEIVITLKNINGESDQIPDNNSKAKSIGTSMDTPHEIYLRLKLDANPQEISWDIKNDTGGIVFSGGSYTSPHAIINETMNFNEAGCYTFSIYDTGGNGLQPPGFLKLYYGANTNILTVTTFGNLVQTQINVGGISAIETNELAGYLQVYPNPATSYAFIEFSLQENVYTEIAVFNTFGQKIMDVCSGQYEYGIHRININTELLSRGVYFIGTRIGNNYMTRRFIKL